MKFHSLIPTKNGLNGPSVNPCNLLDFGFLKLLKSVENNLTMSVVVQMYLAASHTLSTSPPMSSTRLLLTPP